MDTSKPLARPLEVAEHLGVPQKTLAQWRWLGTGPRWSKVGRHVRYRWEDIEAWIDENASTGNTVRTVA